MKANTDKKPIAPPHPTGDRPKSNPPRVDPPSTKPEDIDDPTEPPPVDETDIPTPAVEAHRNPIQKE